MPAAATKSDASQATRTGGPPRAGSTDEQPVCPHRLFVLFGLLNFIHVSAEFEYQACDSQRCYQSVVTACRGFAALPFGVRNESISNGRTSCTPVSGGGLGATLWGDATKESSNA
jgi:hypothetical protein